MIFLVVKVFPISLNRKPQLLPFTSNSVSYYYYYFFSNFILLIYLFLAVLGLHSCTQAFSSCSERGLLFVAVRRLLIAVASLVAEHRLYARRLQ